MSIDGIGKPGAVPSAAPLGSAASAAPAAPFTVTEGAAPEAAVTVSPENAALARLQRGDLDVAGYLDQRVEAATAHLGHLPPTELAFLRESLRAELVQDPVLSELVRRATGASPVDPDP